VKTKQEIIEKIIQNIIITKPHLHFVYSEWCEIIDMAYREGYEQAINNYCKDR
jgi:hypothetical protein